MRLRRQVGELSVESRRWFEERLAVERARFRWDGVRRLTEQEVLHAAQSAHPEGVVRLLRLGVPSLLAEALVEPLARVQAGLV